MPTLAWLISLLVVLAPRAPHPAMEELPALLTILLAGIVTFVQYRKHVLPVLYASEEEERRRVAAGEPPRYPTWGE